MRFKATPSRASVPSEAAHTFLASLLVKSGRRCHLQGPCGLGSTPSSSTLQTLCRWGRHRLFPASQPSFPRFPAVQPTQQHVFPAARYLQFLEFPLFFFLHTSPVSPPLSSIYGFDIFIPASTALHFPFPFSVSKRLCSVWDKFLSCVTHS